jgi:hypothetical protein
MSTVPGSSRANVTAHVSALFRDIDFPVAFRGAWKTGKHRDPFKQREILTKP